MKQMRERSEEIAKLSFETIFMYQHEQTKRFHAQKRTLEKQDKFFRRYTRAAPQPFVKDSDGYEDTLPVPQSLMLQPSLKVPLLQVPQG
jgi:hypothetical protein